jgi:hypothetical protein
LVNFSGLWSNNTLIDRLQCCTFDFGPSPIGSQATTVHVLVENTGPIPFDWNMIFLSDLEVKKEKWVDLGKRNEEEEKQAFIIDNKIFR